MTYNDDNQLKTVDGLNVTVDLDGNLISGPLTNDIFTAYAFDVRNRLLNAGGVTNIYDAMNNRIGQAYGTNSIAYVVNPNAKLPQVLLRIKNGVTNYYIYGAGLLYQITETATATNTLTYHYDYRGSTIALSADNGLVTDRMEYSLYGTLTYRVGTNDTPFLFNGRYGVMTDANGLLYMRARYYNPYLCRFLNADPSGFKGGLNFYAYANGNPASYLDPFGLCAGEENASSCWLSPSDLSRSIAYQQIGANTANENEDPLLNAIGFMGNAAQAYQQQQAAQPAWVQQMNQVAQLAVMAMVPEAGVLDASIGSLAADGAAGDHIVLGLQSFGLEDTASQVGGRTLMSDANWQTTLQTALGDSSTRITVSLDGASGATPYSQFMNAAQQGVSRGAIEGNRFNWEMGQIYQAGRQGSVNFMQGGQVVPNPFH